jgi:hypothetical protein
MKTVPDKRCISKILHNAHESLLCMKINIKYTLCGESLFLVTKHNIECLLIGDNKKGNIISVLTIN